MTENNSKVVQKEKPKPTPLTPEREKAIQEAYERDMDNDDLNLNFEAYILTKIGKQPDHPDSEKRWFRLRALAKLVFLNKHCSEESLLEWASRNWSGMKKRTFSEGYLGYLHKIGVFSWDRSAGAVDWFGKPSVQFKVNVEFKEEKSRGSMPNKRSSKKYDDSESLSDYVKRKKKEAEDIQHE